MAIFFCCDFGWLFCLKNPVPLTNLSRIFDFGIFRAVFSHNFFLVSTQRLYMRVCPSVRRSVGWSVTSYFFGLLGANYAVYTACIRPCFCVWNEYIEF